MLKITTANPINISGSSLAIYLPGQGGVSSLSLTLMLKNHSFESIGYLYSPYISKRVSYESKDSENLTFNGQLYYNTEKQLTLLKLTAGTQPKYMNDFIKELLTFIKEQKFSKITLISGIAKQNLTAKDIESKVINFYYLTNNPKFENKLNLKPIKEAFNPDESKRNGKNYYEMTLVEGCELGRRIIQSLILENIEFLFVFCFADDNIDLYGSLALYYKIRCLMELGNDEVVYKKEMPYKDILNEIQSKVKIGCSWDILISE